MLGYIRTHRLMTDRELADLKVRLARFARREGYALGTVFVERNDRAPAAFQALMAAVQQQDVTAVVVPTMHHFSVLGSPACMKQRLEHCTGARVLIAGRAP